MKKTISVIATILAALFLLCGCGKSTTAEMTSIDGPPVRPASAPPDPFCEVHTFDIEDILVEPGVKTERMVQLTCSVCGVHQIKNIPATDFIKILAIGNSFSVDAMEYLCDICDAAGIGDIVLGNLYIGGCSLDTHWNNIQKDANAYTYYENVYGYWTTKNAQSVPPPWKRRIGTLSPSSRQAVTAICPKPMAICKISSIISTSIKPTPKSIGI